MKHFDLFSGYGGFTLALERAYANKKLCVENERQPEVSSLGNTERQCSEQPNDGDEGQSNTIGFSEIDKYASAVLKYHWPNTKNYGDITKINWSEVPDFDLLTGGSPCQDLSIAGKRAGLDGRRSGLFYEYMRAVKEKRPKYFIWENVKGALSSQGGWDFARVINEMAETGYSLWWQVLNAKDFGVPQNRERIFVIGFRDGSPREIFFKPRNDKENIKSTGQEISYTIDANYAKGTNTVEKSRRQVIRTNQSGLQQIRKLSDDTDSRGGQAHTTNNRIRRLTPTECERLMGLPDGWTSKGLLDHGVIGSVNVVESVDISDSQRYKLCGNGVVVNVVETLLKEIILNDYYKNKK